MTTTVDSNQIRQTHQTRVNNDARPVAFTLLAFFLGTTAAAGLGAAALYHPLWYSIAAGAIIALLMLGWRVLEHDRRAMTHSKRREETSQLPAKTIRPEVVTNTGTNGKHVKLGRYRLTYREWHRLGRALIAVDGRFTRDVVAGAKAFKSLSKNWPEIVAEFERLRMVRDGYLTSTGLAWFNNFVSPQAPPAPPNFDYSEDF